VRAGKARPHDHVALNVALYGPRARRWAMTERGAGALRQQADSLAIGPSHLAWDGQCLEIGIDERGAVWREPVRGTVRVRPEALVMQSFALDPDRLHRWEPIATRARVEVSFAAPGLAWQGDAYVDSNFGSEPMEDRFADWQWSRAHAARDSLVFYEGRRLDGGDFALALAFDAAGTPRAVEVPPPLHPVTPTGWLMPRAARSDAGQPARLARTWEDAPFYSRSTLGVRLFGEETLAVHESLSLTRFRNGLVQWMLPFRMPRRA
jgi:carotenoid 1,2-hydratase